MNNFRLSNKKVYKDSRSSIENLHNEKMNSIFKKYDSIEEKKKKLKFLEEKLLILKNQSIEKKNETIYKINNDIYNLKKDIYEIENNIELIDYIDKAWEFIENFRDNDENNKLIENKEIENQNIAINNEEISNKETSNKETSNKDNDGEKTFNDNIETNILKFINKTGKTNKGEEYNRYYNKCFLNINSVNTNDNSNNCKNCNENNFEIDSKNGLIICNNCASCKQYYSYNGINYNDSTHIEIISQPFSYQRKNHFKEWLNQLQGKEVTVIPDSVINLIILEIKKERITNSDEITSERIKKYLKKLKLNKYYEHIPNLISKITNKPPLIISADFEKVLLDLFDKIQEPFKKHCPKERKNFLSYSYTLHKFCLLLGKKDYLIYFPLLKSREKLFEQERIWKDICNDLGWKFVPSI